MYTHFNIQNISLNNVLVIQIWYTQKEKAAKNVQLEQVFKVPTINL
jgi:hypothetical protein